MMTDALRMATAFAWRNRWRALRTASPSRRITGIAALVLPGIALVWLGASLLEHAGDVVGVLVRYPLPVLAVVGLVCANACQRRRRRLAREFLHGWLAALPIALRTREWSLALRAAGPPVTIRVAVWTLLAVGVYTTAAAAELRLLAIVGMGGLGAAALGWWRGARDPRPRHSALRLSHSAGRTGPAALARLPFAQVLATADPGLHARTIGALVLTIPIGVPLHVCVLMIVSWVSALGLIELARGMLACVPVAATWLRSTPLSIGSLAHTLLARALAVQAIGSSLMVLLLLAFGLPAISVVVLVVAWLALVVTLAGIALACRYQPHAIRTEVLIVAAIALLLAATAPWLLLIAIPVLWVRVWQRARQA